MTDSDKPIQQNFDIVPIKHTPMMQQFFEIKEKVPECLLFYRMGDFYELFFDDAITAAKILDITLTKRGVHQGEDIPMCGVPVHSHESYLHRLIDSGNKIAICEQLEDPKEAKKRGAKSVVHRGITRIVTPGTITEDNLLNARNHNFLCALVHLGENIALAWLDMSTGDFFTENVAWQDLSHLLHRLDPSEILLAEEKRDFFAEIIEPFLNKISFVPLSRFDSKNTENYLTDFFAMPIESLGDFSKTQIIAAGSLIDYVRIMQVNVMPHIKKLQNSETNHYMQIDKNARLSLEICDSLHGRQHSLLAKIDHCRSAGGARLLKSWLNAPLCQIDAILARHHAIKAMQDFNKSHAVNYQQITDLLAKIGDMERSLNRLSLERGSPRDMRIIADNLQYSFELKALLATDIHDMPALIQTAFAQIHPLSQLQNKLQSALKTELPALIRDGGFIKENFSAQLDHLQKLNHDGKQILLGLEQKYKKQSGVESLKIKQNNVLGIFIEIPIRHSEKLDTDFIHRQSTANTARFTTQMLEKSARDIMDAKHKATALEIELFNALKEEILQQASKIFEIADALSLFDLLTSHAEFAKNHDYHCPTINDSLEWNITQGRHPIVELATHKAKQNFIANDCHLSANAFLWILTGPNMAGKSTFLRQNALIAVMAQAGLYVPAEHADIGLIDKLFSRVGAGDDIARGYSTFMVEMLETAHILNNATEKSLVILDEIGRGTATFDGLSLAHAITEYLHDKIKCRTLFATHYHELNLLQAHCQNLVPMHIAVDEYQGEILFSHQIKQGSANRSYGIHVAKLAGINDDIVARATMILESLEENKNIQTLPAHDWQKPQETHNDERAIIDLLQKINPDELPPREALDCLYKLKMLLSKNNSEEPK